MKTYAEKLKDPRWQRKRLEVLQSAGWQCESCQRSNETLHVHHKQYRKCQPWEYERRELMCLCENCHERVEMGKIDVINAIKDLYPTDLGWVLNSIKTQFNQDPQEDCGLPSTKEELDGFFTDLREMLKS